MDLYRQLAGAYHLIAAGPRPPWLAPSIGTDVDAVVAAIRDDSPDPVCSDAILRALLPIARGEPDALTVVMHALAPRLRARLGRAVTAEYRSDALTDLAFVLTDGDFGQPRLVARLVNRAHNRSYKANRATRTRGVVNVTTIATVDPGVLARRGERIQDDIGEYVAGKLDLVRFRDAVHDAIERGVLTEAAWRAYRDHRLARAVDADARLCSNHERTTASRVAVKLGPIVNECLHVA
jgi:hypothetical protein